MTRVVWRGRIHTMRLTAEVLLVSNVLAYRTKPYGKGWRFEKRVMETRAILDHAVRAVMAKVNAEPSERRGRA